MKKLTTLLIIAILVYSCKDDDDNFVAACDEVTNVSSNSITSNSATILWEISEATASYTLEYGVTGFSLGSGTTATVSGSQADLIDLQGNTVYDVYIQTICSSTNLSIHTDAYIFTTLAPNVSTEFAPTLSELNLFAGDLEDLQPSPYAFEYKLSTPLFTDYSHKQRVIALPNDMSMQYTGDGLPIFPDNTVIAKTFYYNNNERDLSLGRQIIETRVLIKLDGNWESGNYKWNDQQTDAVLHPEGSELPVTWIDAAGTTNSTTYKIPSNEDCFMCHKTYDDLTPIGPKLRTLNMDIDGTNQLQQFINNNQLSGLDNVANVRALPNWDDSSVALDNRARAYIDVNCAHCHISGGQCEDQSILNLAYETMLEETNILDQIETIEFRISEYNAGISMPFIGTTILHTEGVALIQAYLDTL
jgi:uncharacterized repeat protein (TIGR03806 family)